MVDKIKVDSTINWYELIVKYGGYANVFDNLLIDNDSDSDLIKLAEMYSFDKIHDKLKEPIRKEFYFACLEYSLRE